MAWNEHHFGDHETLVVIWLWSSSMDTSIPELPPFRPSISHGNRTKSRPLLHQSLVDQRTAPGTSEPQRVSTTPRHLIEGGQIPRPRRWDRCWAGEGWLLMTGDNTAVHPPIQTAADVLKPPPPYNPVLDGLVRTAAANRADPSNCSTDNSQQTKGSNPLAV